MSLFSLSTERVDYYYVFSMFFTFVSSVVLAIFLRLKENPSLTKAWRLTMISTSAWGLGRALMALSTDASTALFWMRFSYAGSIWLSPLWLWVSFELTGKKTNAFCFYLIAGITGFFSVVNWTPYFIHGVVQKLNFQFYDDGPGVLFNVWSNMFTGLLIWAHIIVFKEMRKAQGLTRHRLLAFFLSGFLGFGSSATTFPLVNNIGLYPFGVIGVSGSTVLMSYSVLKHNVMDANLAFRYSVIWFSYVVLGVFLSTAPFLVLGADLKPVWMISLIIGVGGGPFLFKFLGPGLVDLVDRLPFFRGRYLSRAAVAHALAPLHGVETLDRWPAAVAGCVKTLVSAKTCSVLVRDAGKPRLLVKAHIGLSQTQAVFLSSPTDGPLAIYLRNGTNLCVADHIVGGRIKTQETENVLAELAFLKSQVAVPVFFRGELYGIINVGEREDGRFYNELDISHLTELARQSEHRLETLIAGMTHQQMTSMWAHDLIKPFGQKGSMHMIEMAATGTFGPVTPALKSALDLVAGDMAFVKFNLHQVLKPSEVVIFNILPTALGVNYARIRDKYKVEADRQNLRWTVDVPDDLIRVLCDPAIIEHRILANLVENAFRHTPNGGEVTLGYKIQGREFVGFVKDNGPGIRKEDQERLFQPGVQLSKAEGGLAGLGLASVRTVAEAHRGRVWIESEWGKGAAFFFTLPLDKKMGK